MSPVLVAILVLFFLFLIVAIVWAVMSGPSETVVVVEDEPIYPGVTVVDTTPGIVAGTVMGAAIGAAVTEAVVEDAIYHGHQDHADLPAYNGGDTYTGNDGVSSDC